MAVHIRPKIGLLYLIEMGQIRLAVVRNIHKKLQASSMKNNMDILCANFAYFSEAKFAQSSHYQSIIPIKDSSILCHLRNSGGFYVAAAMCWEKIDGGNTEGGICPDVPGMEMSQDIQPDVPGMEMSQAIHPDGPKNGWPGPRASNTLGLGR